jgi:shikimate 5-dehydrogenase
MGFIRVLQALHRYHVVYPGRKAVMTGKGGETVAITIEFSGERDCLIVLKVQR